MPVNGALEKYLVKPGSKVDLKKCDPNDKDLFDGGGKEESLAAFAELQLELAELQKVLYAEQKQRVLVVIQAMDTGGKDGCIRSVFSTIDPQGIDVQPFKKPSEEELAHDFSLAHPSGGATQRANDNLQPQPLRGYYRGEGKENLRGAGLEKPLPPCGGIRTDASRKRERRL